DVGVLQQPPQHALAVLMFQVDCDAALVAVHHQKRGGLIADLRRDHAARVVAVWNFLELDDVRAHVGEHQAAGRPRHHMAQLDDFQTGERSGHYTDSGLVARMERSGMRDSRISLRSIRATKETISSALELRLALGEER